jgi:hypothetical protein
VISGSLAKHLRKPSTAAIATASLHARDTRRVHRPDVRRLIADYYLVNKQRIVIDDLFTMSKTGTYWYKGGYNAKAVAVTVISAAVAVFPVLFGDLPGMTTAAQYSWFVGCGCRSRSAGPPCATARFRRPTSVSRSRSRRYNRHRASAAGQPEHDPVDDGGDRPDAYVLACFGDPGFAEARAMLDVPVLRIDSDSKSLSQ